jgi:hypothetical protein
MGCARLGYSFVAARPVAKQKGLAEPPLRYRDFFEKGRRKDKAAGKVIRWAGGIGIPIVEIYHPVYISLETIVSSKLKEDKRLSEKPPIAAQAAEQALLNT